MMFLRRKSITHTGYLILGRAVYIFVASKALGIKEEIEDFAFRYEQ